MRLNPQKIEALAGCLRACFGKEEFSAGEILKRFAGRALENKRSAALKGAVRALISGRLTRQRLGQSFNRDIVGEALSWRGERWSIEARHDSEAEAWRYRVVDLTPQIKAEGRALFAAVTHEAIERQLAFEEKLDAMPMVKAFDTAVRAAEKRERTQKREAEREAELALNAENREADKLQRQLDKALAERNAAAAAVGETHSSPNGWRDHGVRRGEQMVREIELYRAETAKLKASANYTRICNELKKARHEPSDEMVMRIRNIEAKRKGRPWRAGMSVDVNDYGIVGYAELGIGLGLNAPSTLRNSVQLRGGGWNPFKF